MESLCYKQFFIILNNKLLVISKQNKQRKMVKSKNLYEITIEEDTKQML